MHSQILLEDFGFLFTSFIAILYIFVSLIKALYSCFMAFNRRNLLRAIGLVIVVQIFFVSMRFDFFKSKVVLLTAFRYA